MMPGGSPDAWPAVKPIFQAIAAKVGPKNDIPCCEWVGPRGAGHYVKMVHNGIEYGDMQLICEAYFMMHEALGLSNDELYDVFDEWNRGELDSYLIEITRDIFSVKDKESGGWLVDKIMDRAGAKGTGKWMSQLGARPRRAQHARDRSRLRPLPLGDEGRPRASEQSPQGPVGQIHGRPQKVHRADSPRAVRLEDLQLRPRLRAAAGGRRRIQLAAELRRLRMLWRGGCIIRAVFLDRIKEAFDADPKLENLLLAPYFAKAVADAQDAWRHVVATAAELGIPVPAFAAALAYYDGYRRDRLPANLLQAQRDYFGAHTYERTDKPGTFHTDWIRERRSPVGADTTAIRFAASASARPSS